MTSSKDPLWDLSGQTVLVTGAAGGIGRETARLCAAAGARLVLADAVAVEQTQSVNGLIGHHALVFQCDTSSRAEVERLSARIGPVDALADTAGICPHDDWMAEDWDDAFDRVLDVNLRGPINLVRAFLPGMIERRYGRIALCGSVAGWTGGLRASAHYAAAKGGVHALVRWFAQRATPHQVCVNGVAPGPTETAMTHGLGYAPQDYPTGRLARPEEIAAVLTFLCSPAAGYIAGTIVDANGGVHMR